MSNGIAMEQTTLRIHAEDEGMAHDLLHELNIALNNQDGSAVSPNLEPCRGHIDDALFAEVEASLQNYGSWPPMLPLNDLLVTLGSAGAFTALYQIISMILQRHKERELTFERGETKITIKGHNLPEERELLKQLFPENLGD